MPSSPEPRFGEMWEWGQWRMMFVSRGDGMDRDTTYWIFLELKNDKTGAWMKAYLPRTPRPMASFGLGDEWKKVEA